MYLSDYHTHSRLSFDAHAPLSELAEAAADAGLDELCVTDHFDFLDENGVPAEGYDWAPAVAQHQQALPAAGKHAADIVNFQSRTQNQKLLRIGQRQPVFPF